MGWRYRKSINLGGGFRINLSKSGIGYSWGFPGYRHTYSANGSQRKTYSIPGTGISYVESSGKRKNPSNNNIKYDENTKLITGDTTYYQNSNISNMGKGDEILKQISKVRNINILANICLISICLIPIGIILKLLIAYKWKIDLTYEMDDINQKKFDSLNEFLQLLQQNKRLWQVGSSTRVYNTKYNAGAGNNVSRHAISVSKSMPWYISHNIDVFCLKLTTEKIYFTPDRMLIFKNFSVGCRKYNDMVAGFDTTNFVESEFVPRDAEIIRYTWRYVNKSGGPDKRFNNNRQIPVCKYGEISLTSEDGINILLECSNHRLMYPIQEKFTEFMNYHNKIISSKGYNENLEMEDEYILNDEIINDTNPDDKWNNYNGEYENDSTKNKIVNETMKEPIIVENSKEEPIQPEKEPDTSKKNNKLFTILCYVQVVFSVFMIIGCLSDMMIFGTIMWTIVALIFIPKIKEILISKYEFVKKHITLIRVVLVIVALLSLSTFTNQFEGNWKDENGHEISIDSTNIIINDTTNKQTINYSYNKITDSEYDSVYEIIATKDNNEKIVLRYYKKRDKENLCIYENNNCNDTYSKVEPE